MKQCEPFKRCEPWNVQKISIDRENRSAADLVQPLIVFSTPKQWQYIRITFDRIYRNVRCVRIWRLEIRGTELYTHSKLSRMPFYCDEYECVLWERFASPFAYAHTIVQDNGSAEAPLTHIQLHAIGRKSHLHFFVVVVALASPSLPHRGLE